MFEIFSAALLIKTPIAKFSFTKVFRILTEKSTIKLNSSAYEEYEYGHLGRWYIQLTLFSGLN